MSEQVCPKFEYAVEILHKRWNGLIIYQLLRGEKRFNEIQQAMKISSKVLSERLKLLESEGLVERNVYPEVPVRIEYVLTEKGKSLSPILNALQTWANQWVNV
jgi:DNA-binding HxlR family transcriptional regulator